MPENQDRIRELFATLRHVPAERRSAALSAICGDDGALRQEVELLLDAETTAAVSTVTEPGERLIDVPGYQMHGMLGGGGQGVVYLATRRSTGRRVAIKALKPAAHSSPIVQVRFRREVAILAELVHPGIVSIIDCGELADGSPYLVMDYVEGMSLAQWMKSRSASAPPGDEVGQAGDDSGQALRLFVAICDAVSAAHEKGICHRDLKPANILIDGRGRPHVVDFGLACIDATSADEAGAGITVAGAFFGSLPWASPEQANGQTSQIDPRSDVYSLGVILYQLVTGGRFPYKVTGPTKQVLDNILTAEPPPPSSVLAQQAKPDERTQIHGLTTALSTELDAIVLKALAKSRDDRYATAGELGKDLEAYLAGHRILAAPIAARPIVVEALPNNLPSQLTSFVGREREIAEVGQLLGQTHLLTLTGAGGSGKTRLALEVAGQQLGAFPNGVWLVELAPLVDGSQVPRAIADAIDVSDTNAEHLTETLVARLRGCRSLIVLDNCEHVLPACAPIVATLLQKCRDLKVLATSREPIQVSGEMTYLVPLMTMPDPATEQPWETLSQYEAVRLFIDRAMSAKPQFSLTAANAPAAAQICQQLDGIPLAIELAAAETRFLSPQQIAERLHDRFRLLTRGSRTALPRQQTLEAMIDWSFDLLSPDEQEMFARLSVLVGQWSLDSALEIADGDSPDPSRGMEHLAQLVAKSLVLAEESDGRMLYRMLETIRQYASQKLAVRGEADAIRDRAAEYFAAQADRAEAMFQTAEQAKGIAEYQEIFLNVCAACDWCMTTGRAVELVDLCWARWSRAQISHTHTPRLSVPVKHLEAIARMLADLSGTTRARALIVATLRPLVTPSGRPSDRWLLEALAVAREVGDRRLEAWALLLLGVWNSWNEFDLAPVRHHLESCVRVAGQIGLVGLVGEALVALGNLACTEDGEITSDACRYFERAAQIARPHLPRVLADSLLKIAKSKKSRGDRESARDMIREVFSLALPLGWAWGTAESLRELSALAESEEDRHFVEQATQQAAAFWKSRGGAPFEINSGAP